MLLPPSSRKQRARNGARVFNTLTNTHSQKVESPPPTNSYWTCLEDSVTRGLSPSAGSENAPGSDVDELDELDELEEFKVGKTRDMSDRSDDSAEMKEVEDVLLAVDGLNSDDD